MVYLALPFIIRRIQENSRKGRVQLNSMPQLTGFYSIPAFFLCILIVFALSATPLFSWADTPPDASALPGRRLVTLDGLRGFLALAVVFHHITIYRNYTLTGIWSPPTRFYSSLGEIGVDLFFCITGFLFWSRILRENGHHRWLKLYIGRIFRIGPLFVIAFIAVVVITLAVTHFNLIVSPFNFMRQISVMLLLGMKKIPDINGFDRSELLLDGVEWTLKFEWLFYLSLPLLAIVAADSKWRKMLVLASMPFALVMASLASHSRVALLGRAAFLFLVGMLTASLSYKSQLRTLGRRTASIVLLITITFAVIFEWVPPLRLIFTGFVFYLVACGSSLFGLFLTRPARRLGDISYGIYLLQGLPHALVFRVPYLRNIALASPAQYWGLALLSTVLLCFLALISHVTIERPGIEFGKYVYRKLRPSNVRPLGSQ